MLAAPGLRNREDVALIFVERAMVACCGVPVVLQQPIPPRSGLQT